MDPRHLQIQESLASRFFRPLGLTLLAATAIWLMQTGGILFKLLGIVLFVASAVRFPGAIRRIGQPQLLIEVHENGFADWRRQKDWIPWWEVQKIILHDSIIEFRTADPDRYVRKLPFCVCTFVDGIVAPEISRLRTTSLGTNVTSVQLLRAIRMASRHYAVETIRA